MSLETLIRTRRTHKAFGPEPVNRATLLELFELARWAPNHHLTNPWRFRVLGSQARALLAREAELEQPGSARKLERAPTLIVIGVELQGDPSQQHDDLLAAAVAAYIVLLAAHARGLAGYWRTLPILEKATVRAELEDSRRRATHRPASPRPPGPSAARSRARAGRRHSDLPRLRATVMRDMSEQADRPAQAAGTERKARRPAIVVVNDEPAVLAAVSRDLRRGFGERFRVLRAGSGPEALEVLRELRTRGDRVAMLIADQRMPGMPGTEYLVQARQLVPDAKRVLLTAYADTEAAIAAINEVALDYYLLKPWDPPEEQLFPVVEDLLTTWEAGAALEAGGVRVVGHRFSRESHDLRDFLVRNRVPARWLDVERDGEARELLRVAGVDSERLPVALLEDGTVLERPTILELAERLGVSGTPAQEHYDLVVVGGGPAGLAAAVYGASEGLKTVMVEREAPGGQAGQSSRIENYWAFRPA